VCALSLRCCVFFSLRVLALVSPSFQVSFLQPGKSSLRVLRSMGQGEYHHCQLAVCWSHCRRSPPGSELESRCRASSYSRFVEVLQVSSPVGGSRLRSSSGASSVRLRSLPFEFMFDSLDCRVRRLLFVVLGVVRRRSAGAEVCIGNHIDGHLNPAALTAHCVPPHSTRRSAAELQDC